MTTLCAIGDTHGHLQLALCMAARWQIQLKVCFDAVLLCGDVGTFTQDSQLDSATRRHGKANPCELEFLTQWSARPQPEWLDAIFRPIDDGGLGLVCPVGMVHGNHEGFSSLASLTHATVPEQAVPMVELPCVDSGSHLHWLPSGWRCVTPGGMVVAGVGGIERGQRYADYHELAYLDELAILNLLERPPVDLLVTHQGPSEVQGETKGSTLLQALLDHEKARVWCHGRSTPNRCITLAGPSKGTTVVPLGDVAFSMHNSDGGEPGEDAWATLNFGATVSVQRERPSFWRDYRRKRWIDVGDERLVCPDLARFCRVFRAR